jgi:hypothetical protein
LFVTLSSFGVVRDLSFRCSAYGGEELLSGLPCVLGVIAGDDQTASRIEFFPYDNDSILNAKKENSVSAYPL